MMVLIDVILSMAIWVTFSDVSTSTVVSFGCWYMATEHPTVMVAIETPSIFQMNFSFSIKGVKIAVIIMQKHDVEAIRMRLPNFNAATFQS